jgi:hypothetical protein
MNIQLQFEIGHEDSAFNEFDCGLIVEGLTALAMIFALELAGAEVFEGVELEALCDSLGEQIGSRAVNGTGDGMLIGGY